MKPEDFARLNAAMGGQQERPQQQANPLAGVNPNDFEDEPCRCGNKYFVMVYKVKKLSHLHPSNPTGQDIRSLQQVLICDKCHDELPQ